MLNQPLLLAPMAGITDLPYRLIARSFGCELAFLEMVSAQSIVYDSGRTARMLASDDEDRPLGVQLLGNEPQAVLQAFEAIRERRFALVDVNAACPVPKITKKGKGASLMRDPEKIAGIIKALAGQCDIPVTLKIRAGWDGGSINAREVALCAEAAGASAVTVHGRTREQGYGGRVDYSVIRDVKRAVSIPVIASGDAFSPKLIERLLVETGCDAVAIARGALGNPWLFRDAAAYLSGAPVPDRPSADEIADTMHRHLQLNCDFYGDARGTVLFRKLFAWYVKGLHEIRSLKEDAFRAQTRDAMSDLIDRVREFVYRHPEGIYDGLALSC